MLSSDCEIITKANLMNHLRITILSKYFILIRLTTSNLIITTLISTIHELPLIFLGTQWILKWDGSCLHATASFVWSLISWFHHFVWFLFDVVVEIIPEFVFLGIFNSLLQWLKFLIFLLLRYQIMIGWCCKFTFSQVGGKCLSHLIMVVLWYGYTTRVSLFRSRCPSLNRTIFRWRIT